MLEKKTAESGAAKPKDGKAKAAKATRMSAPMTSRTTARRAAATRPPQESVQERIQQRAYELWETEGRPEGRQHAHWQQAELEITRAHSQRVGASR